jgi:hypothetical protein
MVTLLMVVHVNINACLLCRIDPSFVICRTNCALTGTGCSHGLPFYLLVLQLMAVFKADSNSSITSAAILSYSIRASTPEDGVSVLLQDSCNGLEISHWANSKPYSSSASTSY